MQMSNLEKKARLFKALSEPARLKIISHLMKKECCCCICELSRILKKDPSVVFRHIEILRNAGLIKTKKESKFLHCCISDKKKLQMLLQS